MKRREDSGKWPVHLKEEEEEEKEEEEKEGKSKFIDVRKNAGKCQAKRVVMIDCGRDRRRILGGRG